MTRWRRLIADLLVAVSGVAVAVVGLVYGNVVMLIAGAAGLGVLLLHGDPPVDRDRDRSCVCRGCRRPGRRYPWERLLRKPIGAVPRTHAEGMLGVAHGRLHDLRRLEAEAGIPHSAEVITHFALTEDEWIEPDYDGWVDPFRPGGCSSVPEMVCMELR